MPESAAFPRDTAEGGQAAGRASLVPQLETQMRLGKGQRAAPSSLWVPKHPLLQQRGWGSPAPVPRVGGSRGMHPACPQPPLAQGVPMAYFTRISSAGEQQLPA